MNVVEQLNKQSKLLLVALGFAFVILIGIINYLGDSEINNYPSLLMDLCQQTIYQDLVGVEVGFCRDDLNFPGPLAASEISFNIFYVVPISLIAWFTGRRAGVLVSVAGALTWLALDLMGGARHTHPAVPYWNAAVRLGSFLIITYALSALKSALEQKKRLALMVDSSGDAIISGTVQGAIVSWNTGAERIYGYSAREAKGQPIAILVPLGQLNEVAGMIERIKRGEHIKNYETVQVRKDGRPIDVSVTISPIRDDAGHLTGIAMIARDITERKQVERRLAAQYAVAHILADSATFNEAAPKILAAICENLGWELGAIWGGYRNERVVLRCIQIWHRPSAELTEFKVISQRYTFSPGIELPGRVWASGEPVWIADVVHDTDLLRAPYAAKVGLRGAVGFPIRLNHQILGVIEFFSHDMPQPDADLLKMMAIIGSQIGQFVERKRAGEDDAQL